MEAVGFVASIASITDFAVSTAQKIHKLAHDFKTHAKRINRLGNQIKSNELVLSRIRALVQIDENGKNRYAKAFEDDLGLAVSNCKDVLDEINTNYLHITRETKLPEHLRKTVFSLFQEGGIEQLRRDLSDCEATLVLMLTIRWQSDNARMHREVMRALKKHEPQLRNAKVPSIADAVSKIPSIRLFIEQGTEKDRNSGDQSSSQPVRHTSTAKYRKNAEQKLLGLPSPPEQDDLEILVANPDTVTGARLDLTKQDVRDDDVASAQPDDGETQPNSAENAGNSEEKGGTETFLKAHMPSLARKLWPDKEVVEEDAAKSDADATFPRDEIYYENSDSDQSESGQSSRSASISEDDIETNSISDQERRPPGLPVAYWTAYRRPFFARNAWKIEQTPLSSQEMRESARPGVVANNVAALTRDAFEALLEHLRRTDTQLVDLEEVLTETPPLLTLSPVRRTLSFIFTTNSRCKSWAPELLQNKHALWTALDNWFQKTCTDHSAAIVNLEKSISYSHKPVVRTINGIRRQRAHKAILKFQRDLSVLQDQRDMLADEIAIAEEEQEYQHKGRKASARKGKTKMLTTSEARRRRRRRRRRQLNSGAENLIENLKKRWEISD